MKFINLSERDFVSIVHEEYRCYSWCDGTGDILFNDPVLLSVSNSGHYIVTADYVCHFIPYGWRELYWKPKKNQPHFLY